MKSFRDQRIISRKESNAPKRPHPISSIERDIRTLYLATVHKEINIPWTDDVMTRYYTLNNKPAQIMFNNNLRKMIEKLPLLDIMQRSLSNYTQTHKVSKIIPWIDEWFTRMIFSEVSVRHSIPQQLLNIAKVTHIFALLYAINNRNVILHGSFVSYLINPMIAYSDIDMTCLRDEVIYIISFLIYIFLGIESHVISIPFIINHRQLRVMADQTSICDALKIDLMTLNSCQPVAIKFSHRREGMYLNVQPPCVQFFNYMKMYHIPERRSKMRHYEENQKLILSTIVDNTLKSMKLTDSSLNSIKPFDFEVTILPDEVLLMTIGIEGMTKKVRRIYFHAAHNDINFYPILEDFLVKQRNSMTPKPENRVELNYLIYSQMGSVFPEQRIESIDDKAVGVETHINVSRNEIYRLLSTDLESEVISKTSLLTLWSIYGLHKFFTRGNNPRGVEDHVRVIKTIIEICKSMETEALSPMFTRKKNDGNHVIKRITYENLHIKGLNNEYFATRANLKIGDLKLNLSKGLYLEEYRQIIDQFS